MNPRVLLLLSAIAVACQGTTGSPASAPSTTTNQAPARGSLAEARPLADGQSLPELDIPCEAGFFVGPCRVSADPQTVRTTTTARSTSTEQAVLNMAWRHFASMVFSKADTSP